LEESPFHPELGSRTISACNLAVNLLEDVDDVVSFNNLKSRIDLGSTSGERHKQELRFAMKGLHRAPGPPNWFHDRDSRRITTSFSSTPLPE
jgi:hypothetical protein